MDTRLRALVTLVLVVIAVGGLVVIWGAPSAVVLAGMALTAITGLRWQRRLPLHYQRSVLDHTTRPIAYHLCSLAVLAGSLAILFAGIGALTSAK